MRDDNGVVDFVRPDVLDAHGVEELEGGGFEGADNAQSLVGVQIVGELAAGDGSLELVGDARFGDAFDTLGGVARQCVLKGPLIVAGRQDGVLATSTADKRSPAVLEQCGGLVDFLAGDARSGGFGVIPPIESASQLTDLQQIEPEVRMASYVNRWVPVSRRWTSSILSGVGKQSTTTPLRI